MESSSPFSSFKRLHHASQRAGSALHGASEAHAFRVSSRTLVPFSPFSSSESTPLYTIRFATATSRCWAHAFEKPARQVALHRQQPVIPGCFIRRLLLFTSRRCKLVSDQASIFIGCTGRRQRFRDHMQSDSATAAPRWRGSGGKEAASSLPPACLS